MYRTSIVALAAAAGLAQADIITQEFSYEWSTDDANAAEFSFQPFDDMGGSRTLTSVRLAFDGRITMEVTAQTYDPNELLEGEWSAEASHSVLAYFNGGGLDLLQGVGGQFLDGITGYLGPGSGGFPFGEPGTPYIVSDTVPLQNEVEVSSSQYAAFSGNDPLTGSMAAFFDAVVTPPSNGQIVDVFASLMAQDGTLSLVYEYTVPSPAGLALLGAGGLGVLRRRR